MSVPICPRHWQYMMWPTEIGIKPLLQYTRYKYWAIVVLVCAMPVFGEEKLQLLVWGNYVSPKVIKDFEANTGIQVTLTPFRDDQQRTQLMSASPHTYDLILLDRSTIPHYRDLGWISPLNLDQIPNRRHLNTQWIAPEDYGLAYAWGTVGIAYRADLLEKPPTRWADIFELSEALKGKVIIIDQAEELFMATFKYMGLSVKDLSLNNIDLAFEILKSQRPLVHYVTPSLDKSNGFVSGEFTAGMFYNGDTAFLQNTYNRNIHFALPSDGCILWADYWAVLADAPNSINAHRFINYINSPTVARDNALFLSYATPNTKAQALLPAAIRQNTIIYPKESMLEHCEFFESIPPKFSRELNQAFFMLSGTPH